MVRPQVADQRLVIGFIRHFNPRDLSRWPRGTLYPQKLAITSLTSGGRSVGIVRLRTQTKEFVFFFHLWLHFTDHYHTKTSDQSHSLHCSAWQCFPTADIPLLPGSCPHRLAGISYQDCAIVKVKVTLRHMSRPVRPGVRRPSGTRNQISYLLEILC
jgi:hypothetical protein